MPSENLWEEWCETRQQSLLGEMSWLALVGLFGLQPGENLVGSRKGLAVELPNGPDVLGQIFWAEDSLCWHPLGGERSILKTDLNGEPTVCQVENLDFFVVDRDGQLAVRVRDREWAKKRTFSGLSFFSYQPEWRVRAHWDNVHPPIVMTISNMLGQSKEVEITQRASFVVNGQPCSLLPISVDAVDDTWEAFFVLRDGTSGKSTYGAGRFLKVTGQGSDFELDFNFAFNPPCAFTPFAMCPLPPAENWLPFSIEAGEQKPPKD